MSNKTVLKKSYEQQHYNQQQPIIQQQYAQQQQPQYGQPPPNQYGTPYPPYHQPQSQEVNYFIGEINRLNNKLSKLKDKISTQKAYIEQQDKVVEDLNNSLKRKMDDGSRSSSAKRTRTKKTTKFVKIQNIEAVDSVKWSLEEITAIFDAVSYPDDIRSRAPEESIELITKSKAKITINGESTQVCSHIKSKSKQYNLKCSEDNKIRCCVMHLIAQLEYLYIGRIGEGPIETDNYDGVGGCGQLFSRDEVTINLSDIRDLKFDSKEREHEVKKIIEGRVGEVGVGIPLVATGKNDRANVPSKKPSGYNVWVRFLMSLNGKILDSLSKDERTALLKKKWKQANARHSGDNGEFASKDYDNYQLLSHWIHIIYNFMYEVEQKLALKNVNALIKVNKIHSKIHNHNNSHSEDNDSEDNSEADVSGSEDADTFE